MQRTSQVSPSITVSPPVEGVTIADLDSVESLILSAAPSVATDMDVTSAPPDFYPRSCGTPSSPRGFDMYASSVLRPQTRLGTG